MVSAGAPVATVKRDEKGFPVEVPWRTWIYDVVAGTEVYVVDVDHFVSYRAAGSRPQELERWQAYVIVSLQCGIHPEREETAILYRHSDRQYVLIGDHRRRLENLSVAGLALYYDGSPERCPMADECWVWPT